MTTASAVTESDILADVLAAEGGDLLPEVARSILKWKFSSRAVARMNRLAERNRKGTISNVEREELGRYLRIGTLINLLHAKARLSLESASSIEA